MPKFKPKFISPLVQNLPVIQKSPVVQTLDTIASNFLKGLGYKVSPTAPVSGASIAVSSQVNGQTPSFVYAYSGAISNAENAGGITQNSLASIGSITKSVIAFLLARVIANSNGEMSFDDPIEKYFLQFNSTSPHPAWGKPTIKNLLQMTSGLPDYLDNFDFYIQDPQKNWSLQELISAMPQLGQTTFAPGTQYDYSNTNYILLGMLLEQITGSSIQTLVENLANEIGIGNEMFYPLTLIPNINEIKHRFLHPIDVNGVDVTMIANPSILGSAGAIVATPIGICTWINWLFDPTNNPYLATMQQIVSMTTGQPISQPTEEIWGYGFGLVNGLSPTLGNIWMYQGEIDGSTANWYRVNTSNLGTVVASFAANTYYTNVPNGEIANQIIKARGAIPIVTQTQPQATPVKQPTMSSVKEKDTATDETKSRVSRFLNYNTDDLCDTLKKTFDWFCCPLSDCVDENTSDVKKSLISEVKPK